MRIALLGSDIPNLLPSLLADMFYAARTEGLLVMHEPDAGMAELYEAYAGRVLDNAPVSGGFKALGDPAEVLRTADCVILSDSRECVSRFQMDRQALGGTDEGSEGLSNQARVGGGIGGLLFTMRQGTSVSALADVIKANAPDAFVVNLTRPLSQMTALLRAMGISAIGLGEGVYREAGDFDALLSAIGKERTQVRADAAGLHGFMFLTALMEADSGKNLLPEVRAAVRQGLLGAEKQAYWSLYDAYALGAGHGDALMQMPVYNPSSDPVLTESVEGRMERLMAMRCVAKAGLVDGEGAQGQWTLLSKAPSVRPIACALRRGAGSRMVLRANHSVLSGLPEDAIIQASMGTKAATLGEAAMQTCGDIALGRALSVQAALGDRESLRRFIDEDISLMGLDRLYLHELTHRLIELHAQVLPLYA